MAEAGDAAFGGRRPYLVIAVGVAVLFTLLFLFFRSCGSGGGGYTVIYSDLDLKDTGLIAKKLDGEKLPYRLEDEGHSVAVPKDLTARARMLLATEGLPSGGVVGFEIFDETQMGASSFDRRVKLIRAISGELSRAVASLAPVDHARVQIVIPEERLFTLEKSPVTASVLVRMQPGQDLEPEQVNGIVYLVSSSVEGLKPENVAVIDESSRILSGTFDTRYAAEVPPAVAALSPAPEEPAKVVVDATEGEREQAQISQEPVSDRADGEKPTESSPEKSVTERWQERVAIKTSMEEALAKKGKAVLSTFYPEHAFSLRINVSLIPDQPKQVGQDMVPGVARLTALVLLDEKFPLTSEMKKDTYAALAAAIGYDKTRNDRIELRRVSLAEMVVQGGEGGETAADGGGPGFLGRWFQLRNFLYVGLALLVVGGVVRLRRAMQLRAMWQRGDEPSSILRPRGAPRAPTRPVASPPPGRTPKPAQEKPATLEEIQTLADKDPEKIASVLKQWLENE